MYYALQVDAILFTVYGVTRLNSPEQVSSLIPGHTLVQILVCVLFCVYYYGCYAANCYVIVFNCFGFLFASFDVLNELG